MTMMCTTLTPQTEETSHGKRRPDSQDGEVTSVKRSKTEHSDDIAPLTFKVTNILPGSILNAHSFTNFVLVFTHTDHGFNGPDAGCCF